ncbi:MAG: hypothetical protein ACNA7K_03200 [Acholeplasmataceae bacterium]
MYQKFKRNQLILIYVNIVFTSIFGGILIYFIVARPNILFYLIYPYLVFETVWLISWYHIRHIKPKQWLFRRVQVIQTEISNPLPDKFEIGVSRMNFLGDIYILDGVKIHQKLVRAKDTTHVFLFPQLEKLHSKNEYKIVAIYLEWVIVKDLSRKSFLTHLTNIEFMT